MNNIKIRFAEIKDAKAILDIYSPYVKNSAITFEYEVPTIKEFENRILIIKNTYPYLVCTISDKIVGYAYASEHRSRAAYNWNVETSIYINEQYHGRGIASSLYSSLIDILKLQNIKNVYGGMTVPNLKSEKLHLKLGFKELCCFNKTGYKLGKWHDVKWFEKTIGKYDINPQPVIPINQIDIDHINKIFKEQSQNIKAV